MSDARSAWDVDESEFPRSAGPREQLRFLVRYAVLAPSSHNTQPWRFRVGDRAIDVCADWSRHLPATDPTNRELLASCGAAVHNLRVALGHFGFDAHVTHFPEAGDPDLVARIRVDPAHAPTPVPARAEFDAITRRRTDRSRYADRAVPGAVLSRCTEAAHAHGGWFHVVVAGAERAALADLVVEADEIQRDSEAFREELRAWLRTGHAPVGDGLPGTAFGVGERLSFAAPLIVRRFRFGEGRAAADREIALGSPVLAVLGTTTDTLVDRVRAGEALEAVLLCACAEGVSVSYLNQPVEIPELRARMPGALRLGGHAQMVLRMGYGEGAAPTPRRALEDFLLEPE